jgi:hypothetical protein
VDESQEISFKCLVHILLPIRWTVSKVKSVKTTLNIFSYIFLAGLYDYDSTMPSAPPLDQMEQVSGYETISFNAGMSA